MCISLDHPDHSDHSDHSKQPSPVLENINTGTPTPETIAEGVWCTNCEFFESNDNMTEGRCMGCGCREIAHTDVKIVEVV